MTLIKQTKNQWKSLETFKKQWEIHNVLRDPYDFLSTPILSHYCRERDIDGQVTRHAPEPCAQE